MRKLSSSLVLASTVLFAASGAIAAPVTNWHTFKATPAAPLAGQGTDDPVVGTITETADASFVIGYLNTPITLANVGDQITLTFSVRFNDATAMANAGDNFRFALFDENGQTRVTADTTAAAGVDTQTDRYRGYIFGVKNGTGTGSGGSTRERIADLATGDNSFAATGGNSGTITASQGVGGDPVTLAASVNGDNTGPTYSAVMTITKTASGADVTGSFIGTNAATGNTFSFIDTTAPTSSSFGAVGFLIGDALNVEQVSFQDVTITTNVPEPAAAVGLLGLSALATGMRRRRRRA